jgi:heptosyltransferase-2
MDRKIEKILIIRFSSLGDVILTTPVVGALKSKFPESKIFFLTKVGYRDLLRADPRVSELVEFDPHGEHKGISGFLRLATELRKRDFDLLVDLHSNLRSFFLRRLVKSRIKLKYHKRWLSRFLMVHCKFLKTKPICTIDSYLGALKKLQIGHADRNPRIFPASDDLKFAENFLLEHHVKKGDIVIAVHPGAKWDTKRWNPEKFAEVCRTLVNRLSAKLMLLGEDGEEAVIRKVKSGLPADLAFEALGLPLAKLAALIRGCDCLISNDSGPMHLASASGVPVVAIFGPTHPKLGFAPVGSENLVLCADVECSPCSLHGEKKCNQKSRFCMDLIEPDQVVQAVEQLVKEKKSNSEEI